MAATVFDAPEPMLSPSLDQPMFASNPVLTRSSARRSTQGGGGKRALMIGVPIAVVALAVAGIAFMTSQRQAAAENEATAEALAPPVAQTNPEMLAGAGPVVGPVVNPVVAAPTPPVTTAAAPSRPARQAVNPPVRHARPVTSPRAAPDTGADVNAIVAAPPTEVAVPAPPPVIIAPPPPEAAPVAPPAP